MRDARVALHVALTAVMMWLAVVLAWSGGIFGSSNSYAIMHRIGPEHGWAVAFWLVASVGVSGLVTAGPLLRLASVLVLATAHGLVALSFVLSNPASTGTGTYAVLAMLGYYLAWRRADDVL